MRSVLILHIQQTGSDGVSTEHHTTGHSSPEPYPLTETYRQYLTPLLWCILDVWSSERSISLFTGPTSRFSPGAVAGGHRLPVAPAPNAI